MAKFELVKFIDPNDGEETFAQFDEHRTQVAIYNSERIARRNLGDEPMFNAISEVLEQGGEYAVALKAALKGEVVEVYDSAA